MALAFITGNLLADLSTPSSSEGVTGMALISPETAEWLTTSTGFSGLASIVVILLIAIGVLSGLRKGIAFLPPTLLLAMVACVAGSLPVGREATLVGRVASLEESRTLESERAREKLDRVQKERSSIEDQKLETDRLVAQLQVTVEEARKLAVANEYQIQKLENEIDLYLARIKEVTDADAIVKAENTALRLIQKERDALKVQIAELNESIVLLKRERGDRDRIILKLKNELLRLQNR